LPECGPRGRCGSRGTRRRRRADRVRLRRTVRQEASRLQGRRGRRCRRRGRGDVRRRRPGWSRCPAPLDRSRPALLSPAVAVERQRLGSPGARRDPVTAPAAPGNPLRPSGTPRERRRRRKTPSHALNPEPPHPLDGDGSPRIVTLWEPVQPPPRPQ